MWLHDATSLRSVCCLFECQPQSRFGHGDEGHTQRTRRVARRSARGKPLHLARGLGVAAATTDEEQHCLIGWYCFLVLMQSRPPSSGTPLLPCPAGGHYILVTKRLLEPPLGQFDNRRLTAQVRRLGDGHTGPFAGSCGQCLRNVAAWHGRRQAALAARHARGVRALPGQTGQSGRNLRLGQFEKAALDQYVRLLPAYQFDQLPEFGQASGVAAHRGR